jgi:MFS family permease
MACGQSCIVRDIGPSTAPRAVAVRGSAPATLRRARVAATTYFVVLGLADGVWLARIPAVKQNLRLSDGLLGVALLAAPAGLVLVAAFADRLIDRFGSPRLMVAAGAAFSLLPVALGLAPSMAALMVVLLAFGLVGGLLDVAMNAQAVRVERGYRRPLITSFHACYSFGGLAGALLGGLFAWAGIGPALTFTAVGVPLAGIAVLARRGLLHGPEARDPSTPDQAAGQHTIGQAAGQHTTGQAAGQHTTGQAAGQHATGQAAGQHAIGQAAGQHATGQATDQDPAKRAGRARWRRGTSARIITLGLLALCCLLGEGAAGSWSAVYLRDNLGTSAGFAALGYAAFSVTMAVGRLLGDRLAARFGAARLVSGCGIVAALGLAGALISASPAVALIGFALFGAGMSSTFPQLVSAAGNVATSRSGTGIARVAGAGYLGLLAGPVLIGSCASLVGLRLALAIPVVAMVIVAAGGRAVAGPGRRASAAAAVTRPRPRR